MQMSILESFLGVERSDKLIACLVQDIIDGFENPKEAELNDLFAWIIDDKIGSNPAIQVIQEADDDAIGEIIARLIVELDWQSRQGRDYAAKMQAFALYLADWVLAHNDEEEEETPEDDYQE